MRSAAVEQRDAKVVVIDSFNGYLNAMPEERHLTIQLHELQMFLGPKGVATVLVGAQDAVILLRYLEANGEVRTTISVMNKRGSAHERTLREFRLDAGRISVGKALRDFRGVLTGVPTYDSSCRHSNDPEEL